MTSEDAYVRGGTRAAGNGQRPTGEAADGSLHKGGCVAVNRDSRGEEEERHGSTNGLLFSEGQKPIFPSKGFLFLLSFQR